MRGALMLALVAMSPAVATAQQQTVTFGGFVDTYIAMDFGRPYGLDRAYTTQAARHSEFNVNLAYLDAVLDGDRVRGRLALQAGTSVLALYRGEPQLGEYSGGALSRHVQEAVVGVRMREGLWVDGGIFLSHIGTEQWISRENDTYTRSLIADFSPYYHAGMRVSWDLRSDVTALFTIVNGWQNVSENNGDKSIGVRFDWAVSPHITLAYYNLIGNEQDDTLAGRVRVFNGLAAAWASDEFSITATLDGGREARPGGGQASWWGMSLVSRVHVTDRVSFAGRVEAFDDPDRVLVNPPRAAFNAIGGSVGLDVEPDNGVLWRTEFRALRAKNSIFPDRGVANGFAPTNTLFVTSLAIAF